MYRLVPLFVIAAAVVLAPHSASTLLGNEVQKLTQSKDVPGLVLVRRRDGTVRSSTAVALSGVIREVESARTLAHSIQPLVDVLLHNRNFPLANMLELQETKRCPYSAVPSGLAS